MLRQPISFEEFIVAVLTDKIETIRQYIAENRDNPVEINRTDQFGDTALIIAAKCGHTTVVEALLAVPGINVNAANQSSGDTALIIAAKCGHTTVVEALLAVPGINVNAANQSSGYTALIIAATCGDTTVVEALLAVPCINVNAVTRLGNTALILAAYYGYLSVVVLLLATPNIDINAQNNFHLTAAAEAEKRIYERPYIAHIYRKIYNLITASIRRRATEKAIIAILTYWHGEHKFISAIRLLNKHWRDYVAKQITGPYSSKAHFIFANTGIYHTKKVAMEAFRVYERTIHSASTLPAVFYALSERSLLKSTLFKEPGFTGGDNIYKNGRVYGPKEMHAWDINASWVFAQLHKRRHIQVMTSYPVGDNTHRRGGDYSALTKEIALAFRAGYDIVNVEFRQDGRRIVHLGPAHLIHSIILSLSLRDLILTDEDCQFAIRHMKNMVDNVYKTNQLNAPITLFSNSAPNQQRCVPAPPLSFSP